MFRRRHSRTNGHDAAASLAQAEADRQAEERKQAEAQATRERLDRLIEANQLAWRLTVALGIHREGQQ